MAFRSRHCRAFRRAAWLGVLAVLLQILVPAVHHPVAALGQSFLFADSVICSASRVDSDRAVIPDKAPTKNASHCPVCWGLQQLAGGFVVPGGISAPGGYARRGRRQSPRGQRGYSRVCSLAGSSAPRSTPPRLANRLRQSRTLLLLRGVRLALNSPSRGAYRVSRAPTSIDRPQVRLVPEPSQHTDQTGYLGNSSVDDLLFSGCRVGVRLWMQRFRRWNHLTTSARERSWRCGVFRVELFQSEP